MLTYKYRIRDRCAKKTLCNQARAVNAIWNYCCAQQRDTEARYRAGAKPRRWATYFDLTRLCNGVGKELGLHQQSVGGVCRAFAQARDKLKHAPRFRASFGGRRVLGWIPFERQSRQIDADSITYLGKTYKLFGTKRRSIPDNAKGGCFVEDALGRWWVCFHVEVEREPTAMCGDLGIDLGLKTFATCSDGGKIEMPRAYRQIEAKLAIAQRANNKQRAKALHVRAANVRRDFHHKVSTELAARYALIAVGNVSAKQLVKTRMAKSVLDAGWSTFRSMLAYKAADYREVDEKFTTQTCSCCGSLSSSERPRGIAGLGIREWRCSDCGASHDRDVNAAKNILALARSAPRPAVGSRRAA